MRETRRQFSREYKLEAVRLITEGGRRPGEVARDLSVRADMLRRWKREVEVGTAPAAVLGLRATRPRRPRPKTTDSLHALPIAPNLLARRFSVAEAGGLNRVWVGDITYVPTREGWLGRPLGSSPWCLTWGAAAWWAGPCRTPWRARSLWTRSRWR